MTQGILSSKAYNSFFLSSGLFIILITLKTVEKAKGEQHGKRRQKIKKRKNMASFVRQASAPKEKYKRKNGAQSITQALVPMFFQ